MTTRPPSGDRDAGDGRPPALDPRGRTELLADANALVPYYTPEWDATSDDSGAALLELFASMADGVVDRLNRVPEKQRVAFFDALGFGREPPQAARLPLSFTVDDGLDRNVAVPAGTRATAAATGGRGAHAFEIAPSDAFEATPARIERAYGVDPSTDRLYDLWTSLDAGESAELFGGADVQRHAVYVGDAEALALPPGSAVHLRFETATPASLFWTLEWEYYGVRLETTGDGEDVAEVEGWHTLRIEGVDVEDGTVRVRARVPGTAVELSETTVDGVESRWVRCRLPEGPSRSDRPKGAFDVDVTSVTVGTEPRTLPPDLMLANDVPVPVEQGGSVLPFGEQPQTMDAFYISSEAAFTKRGSQVRLDVETAPNGTGDVDADVSWQYWNGAAWARLEGLEYREGGGWRPIDASSGDGVTVSQLVDGGTLRFTVPDDLASTTVAGTVGHWIRARFVDGTYGRVTYVRTSGSDEPESGTPEGGVPVPDDAADSETEQWSVALGDLRVPRLTSVSVGYGYDAGSKPRRLVTHNNRSYSENLVGGFPDRVRLFEPVTDESQTVYLGVDRPLRGGPIQLYLPTVDREYPAGFRPRLRWEACGPGGRWTPLDARDGTDGFTRTGIVSLVFPEATTACRLFDETRHWVRARIAGAQFEPPSIDWTPPPSRTLDVSVTNVSWRSGRGYARVRGTLQNDGTETVDLSGYFVDFGLDLPREAVGAIPSGERLPPGGELAITGGVSGPSAPGPEEEGLVFVFDELQFAGARLGLLTPDQKVVAASEVAAGDDDDDIITPLFGAADGESRGRRSIPADERRLSGLRADVDLGALFPIPVVRPRPTTTKTVELPTSRSSSRCEPPADRERCARTLETDPPTGPPVRVPPTLRGVHLNTGWATNVSAVRGELLGSSDGTPSQEFVVSTPPAIEAAVWVDELSALSDAARRELADSPAADVDAVLGTDGEPREFWVRWTSVGDFLSSGPDDRHVAVDPTTGRVEFGDGTRGTVPPRGRDNVRADYETGGGAGGNVAAGAVSSLVTSIAFVDEVTNPDPGDGGADVEPIETTLERAPRTLRDRNRAVTAADYRRLALSTSRRLARATCIPGLDLDGDRTPGWVTVLVVPHSSERRPTPSAALKQTVRDGLADHAPASVVAADPSRLVVRGPSYVELAVTAELTAGDVGSVSAVEAAANDALTAFFHPLTGGPRGTGWEFGELPCLSDCYVLLEGLDGVDHVSSLAVTFRGAGDPVTVEEGGAVPTVAADTLVHSGVHDLTVGRVDAPTTEVSE